MFRKRLHGVSSPKLCSYFVGRCEFEDWTSEEKDYGKKRIKWKKMAKAVQQRAGDNKQYQFTRKFYEGGRAKFPLEKR